MLPELNDGNWAEAFGYAGEPNTCGSANIKYCENTPRAIILSDVDRSPFTREDVVRILGLSEGKRDGEYWVGVFLLKDGRYASLRAGCDYTGWD